MNPLLLPLGPEPAETVTVYCEGCGDPVERRQAIQCSGCEMYFHQEHWWDLDPEQCKDCTLARLARLERMAVALLRGDVFEGVREELLKGRAGWQV